jgi:AcrR family transcriptional regulator
MRMARARLRQERSRASRKAIVTAADELWRARDFDAVPVEEVCLRAGVAKGSFYFYFPRKEHLLVQLVFGRFLPREAVLQGWLAGGLSTGEICAAFVSGLGAQARRLPPRLVLRAVEESFAHYREIEKLEGGDRSLRYYLAPIFARGVARGEVRPEWDIPVLAGTLGWGVLQELFLWGEGKTADRDLIPNLRQRAQLLVAAGAAARPAT